MALINEKGYVQIKDQMVHVDVLRTTSPSVLAPILRVSEQSLREWAKGPGLPIGLNWDAK